MLLFAVIFTAVTSFKVKSLYNYLNEVLHALFYCKSFISVLIIKINNFTELWVLCCMFCCSILFLMELCFYASVFIFLSVKFSLPLF